MSNSGIDLRALPQTAEVVYVCVIDFFNQVIENTNEFRNLPLTKVWLGPVPVVVLFHAETIEVNAFVVF